MSVLPVGFGSSGDVDVGDIGHSLRCRAAASAYLSKTLASPTLGTKYTIATWVKFGTVSGSTSQYIMSSVGTIYEGLFWDGSTGAPRQQYALTFFSDGGSVAVGTSVLIRDPSAWYPLILAIDTTQATAADRVRFYLPSLGGSYTSTPLAHNGSSTYPTQNSATGINSASAASIGRFQYSANQYLDGHLSRVCFVDGQALTPSSFGYLNTATNEWVTKTQSQIKAVVDAGGTNSFMLDFDNATSLTTLGYDKSSKGNNWTLNNFSLTAGVTYDHMLDVPGNNYATLNPLVWRYSTTHTALTNGALTFTNTGASTNYAFGTISVTSGIWWAECTVSTTGAASAVGVDSGLEAYDTTTDRVLYAPDGKKYVAGAAGVAYGATYTTGDVIGVELNKDAGTVTFYKQTAGAGAFASQGAITLPTTVAMTFETEVTNTSGVMNWNFGQRPFNNSSLPTNAKALCTANMPVAAPTASGSFTGNTAADGPFVWIGGVPSTLTINSNAVTFGTHADKTAGGFKLRTSSSSYNAAGSNTWTATFASPSTKSAFSVPQPAQGNP